MTLKKSQARKKAARHIVFHTDGSLMAPTSEGE